MIGAKLIGQAICKGRMYDLGWFPGVRLDGAGEVVGEVFELPTDDLEQALIRLDRYEGVSHTVPEAGLYTREQVHVRLVATNSAVTCWIYQYNTTPLDEQYNIVSSGDWLEYTNHQER